MASNGPSFNSLRSNPMSSSGDETENGDVNGDVTGNGNEDLEEEKKDNLTPLKRPSGIGDLLGTPLSRVPSRRISQIVSVTSHNRFTVKTPIEKNFDMPELVDFRRVYKLEMEEEEEEDNDGAGIFCQDQGGMQMKYDDGREGNAIYFCGIIDVLQKYNKRKKVENFFRGLNTDTSTISAVPPDQYSQRMYEFLTERIK